jgi:tRNA-dihydrouridine synthase B
MHIGGVQIDPSLVLAPMEGVTDLSFRRLIRRIGGCGLTITEFIPAASLVRGEAKFLQMAQFDEDEHPVAVQVYGRDPQVLADAARAIVDSGADIVDLNMGCPSKQVCKNSGGSALMREPQQARKIIAAMRAAISVPLTVKMRSGWDHEHRNALQIARMCVDEGVDGLAIHWRTRADRYGGVRELHTIAEVVASVPIPVLANGDIVCEKSAMETLRETGAAGLMIGRGAVRDPWVFRRIERAMSGSPDPVVSLAEREALLLDYYASIRPLFRNDKGALGRMKKIARYFADGVPDGSELRTAIFRSKSVEEVYDKVRAHFAQLRAA